ncbi:hypothetical protein ACFTAO_44755 [Paenibacillus rhizoplanae]
MKNNTVLVPFKGIFEKNWVLMLVMIQQAKTISGQKTGTTIKLVINQKYGLDK